MAKTKNQKSKTDSRARQVKSPDYSSFRLQKRIKHPAAPLSGAFRLLLSGWQHIWAHKRLFFGIAAVYLVLTLILVRGFSLGSDIGEAKEVLREVVGDGSNQLVTGLTLFGYLLGSAGSAATELGSLYQSILLVVTSLALIWALRQTHAGADVGLRDTFYKGMYPLIPFLLVMFVILLQLLPLALGSMLYSAVVSGGIAVTAAEKFIWVVLFGATALLSLYMVSSSLFALYIVTLPDTWPMQALRSARELVRHRRWMVMRKLLFLPLALVVIAALVLVPVLWLWAPAAEWLFFFMTAAGLVLTHSYLYGLYRELL